MDSKSVNHLTTRFVLGLAGMVLSLSPAAAFGQATFQGLGDLPGGQVDSRALGVSADGSVVVGASNFVSGTEAFRWTLGGGMVGLGDLPGSGFLSVANGISADGAVVVGYSVSASGTEAFRWTAGGGMVGLGDLAGGGFFSGASGTSGDGAVVVGWGISASGGEAFRWTLDSGMVGLGDLPGGSFHSEAFSTSADGSVVVGASTSGSGGEAFRWTSSDGMVGLGDVPGGGFSSRARGISPDGSVVVGSSVGSFGTEAFRWTAGSGMIGLGDIPGGVFRSEARATSDGGSVIVGLGNLVGTPSNFTAEAFIWDCSNGMRSLQVLLVNDYGLDLTGWDLFEATAISRDGMTIVGLGTNPSGEPEGWIVTLPLTTCCGNGIVEGGESCDDGFTDACGSCNADCTGFGVGATCGDATLCPESEECDDGAGNSDTAPDACRTDCTNASCGDGVVDSGEQCDDGMNNSDTAPDACRTDCTNPSCGDGVVDFGEQCDGAGESPSCDVDCTVAECGDGTINVSAGEECDDAGQTSTCNFDCTVVVMPSFQGLGGDGVALAVSADGTVVVGTALIAFLIEAFRWTSDGGMVGLGDLPGGRSSQAFGTSGDGTVVVGASTVSTNSAGAFLWTSGGGMVGLGFISGSTFDRSEASGISADGTIVVGQNSSSSIIAFEAFRWTSGGGMVGLGNLFGGSGSSANAISADGLVIVGWSSSASGRETFRWTLGGGMVALGDLPGGSFSSEAFAVSADGGVVVGQGNSASGKEAFRWTANGGMIGLGDLPGDIFESYAFATSADGAVVVGRGSPESSFAAFLWTADDGMRLLRDILVADLGLDLTGWELKEARGISADGTIIVGRGINPSGNHEGWIATLGSPPLCGNGVVEGTEQCDNGPGNSDSTPDACRTDCTNPSCGDGVVDSGDECDDAGESPTCDVDCTVPECGDGTLNVTAGEECDDGNADDGDGCSSICTVEDECACSGEPSLCACRPVDPPDPNSRKKNRYISFAPNNSGRSVKLKVTLTSSLPHPALVGSSWWVQEPITPVPDQFPRPLVGASECVAILGPEATAANIDWDAAGCQVLHVTGCPVEPTSSYEVQAVAGTAVSGPLAVPTALQPDGGKWWGDTVGVFNGTEWTAPQGVVNFDDVFAALVTFQGGQVVPPGPIPPGNVAHLAIADVEPGSINTVVNFADVQQEILAFKGGAYPFGPADLAGNCP